MANIKKSQKKSQEVQQVENQVENQEVILGVSQVENQSQEVRQEVVESEYKNCKFIINNNSIGYTNFDNKKNNLIDYTDLLTCLKDKKNIDAFISLLLKIKHIEIYI